MNIWPWRLLRKLKAVRPLRRTPDSTSTEVQPMRELPRPHAVTLGPHDKLTLTLSLDILGCELDPSHIAGTVEDCATRARAMIQAQLAVTSYAPTPLPEQSS